MIRVLLDSSVVIALLQRRPSFAAAHWSLLDAETEVILSSIVAGEIAAGFYAASNSRSERRAYSAIANGIAAREFGFDAAESYGRVRAALRKRGTPVGPVDELIAAHALALGSDVATLNAADFRRVPGLRVRDWSVAA